MCARLFESLACILHFFFFFSFRSPSCVFTSCNSTLQGSLSLPFILLSKNGFTQGSCPYISGSPSCPLIPPPLLLTFLTLLWLFIPFVPSNLLEFRKTSPFLSFFDFYSNATAEYLSRTLLQNIYVVALALVMPVRRRGWCERVACALIGSLSP